MARGFDSTPASTRARRRSGSISIPRMRSVLRRRVSRVQSIGPVLWPPALKAMRRSCCGGEAHGRDDVVRRLGIDDGDGTLVDGQVPGLPRGVPGRVARQDDVAGKLVGKSAKVHGLPRDGGASGRRANLSVPSGPEAAPGDRDRPPRPALVRRQACDILGPAPIPRTRPSGPIEDGAQHDRDARPDAHPPGRPGQGHRERSLRGRPDHDRDAPRRPPRRRPAARPDPPDRHDRRSRSCRASMRSSRPRTSPRSATARS